MRRKADKDKTKEKEVTESPGQRLRSLRESKGISLEEAYQKTKIHPRVLKALEENAVGGMSPIYVKGLLKIYCNFLGVDYKDFIEDYSRQPIKERPQEEAKEEVMQAGGKIQPPLHLLKPQFSLIKKIKLKTLVVICFLVFAALAFKLGKTISAYRASFSKKSPLKAGALKPKSPSVKPTASKLELGIRAKEDCWMEIKTDGKVVLRGVLKKGNYEKWEAEEKIEFSLGNAGGVDVEVNGKLLPPLGRRHQVIKNIVLTKQGLTVPQ